MLFWFIFPVWKHENGSQAKKRQQQGHWTGRDLPWWNRPDRLSVFEEAGTFHIGVVSSKMLSVGKWKYWVLLFSTQERFFCKTNLSLLFLQTVKSTLGEGAQTASKYIHTAKLPIKQLIWKRHSSTLTVISNLCYKALWTGKKHCSLMLRWQIIF